MGSSAARLLAAHLNAYTLSNAATLAAFWWARAAFYARGELSYSRCRSLEEMATWEAAALKLTGTACLIKLLRRGSRDSLADEILWYIKLIMLGLSLMMDVRMAVCLAALMQVVYLVFPRPPYSGPSNVEELTPAGLRSLVEDGDTPVLVEFYTQWSGHSGLQPVLARLSLEYGAPPAPARAFAAAAGQARGGAAATPASLPPPQLRFGCMDVGQWPTATNEHSLPANRLPVLVMFEHGGEEAARLPDLKEDTWLPLPAIQREHILAVFELERRATGAASPAGGAAAPAADARKTSKASKRGALAAATRRK